MRHIKLFESVFDASSATDLVSLNVSYISGSSKLLMKDCNEDGKELQINVDASGNVSIDEKASTETWLLKSSGRFGDWVTIGVNFTSNGRNFSEIDTPDRDCMNYYTSDGELVHVYDLFDGWKNEAYRTIVLSEPAVEGTTLYNFLTKNAEKQS